MRQRTWAAYSRRLPPLGNDRGMVLAMTLIIMTLLMAVGSTALFSGYTNLVGSTNLKLAAEAQAIAEAQMNEALYRLSRQEGQPGALAPDLSSAFWNDPDWMLDIVYTTGDTDPTDDNEVSTLRAGLDWPDQIPTRPLVLQYKKPDPVGSPSAVVFYDRTLVPPFRTITLPAATIPDTAHPVIQIWSRGRTERDAEREILAEVSATPLLMPPAPLSSGVDVNLGGSAFIDGVNHDHRIVITGSGGAAGVYGDGGNSETTSAHPGNQIDDSPDDNADTGAKHEIANPSLAGPAYDSKPRIFNMQISATDEAPAWVGVTKIMPDQWAGANQGYAAAIALATGPAVVGAPVIPASAVLGKGVFSWRMNNDTAALTAAPGTGCAGATSLVCRPAALTPFPTLQAYLGLDDAAYDTLLDQADTCGGDTATCGTVLSATNPPLGFTYVKMAAVTDEFNLDIIDVPDTTDFGLLYVDGSLRMPASFVFKGLIFVEGDLVFMGSAIVLGAIMVRGQTSVTFGAGGATILYSRRAAEIGLQTAHPWRILSWVDTALLQ